MQGKNLTIIIPVFNESKTIQNLLNNIKAAELINGIGKEVIIVNDHSTDDTNKAIQDYISGNNDLKIICYDQVKNLGKGAAIRKGLELASGDFILVQDADLEYDPAEYNLLLQPVVNGFADVVYGSRFIGGYPHRILFFWHSLGNKILTLLSNIFTGLSLTDMETCYKLFKAEVLRQITLREDRFGFEPEVTAKISKIPGLRSYEVGISYYGRSYYEGKKIGWKDGFRTIWCILKYNLWSG
jgi:glycosyltransferase involved in cell wall biosynthesis